MKPSCDLHEFHTHVHGKGCGHTAIRHNGRLGYLHDGHLHFSHGDHVDEQRLQITDRNPAVCTPDHDCPGHEANHQHGAQCGHDAVPHGDHVDYLVAGHLHHPHDGHCDDHGPVEIA